jgi:hypothetical protein
MIRSLEDAWEWYTAVRTLAYDMRHLAGRCDRPEWAEVLRHDNRLRHRTAAQLSDMARTILDDLDDLAVLVLFSVFEATVRSQAGADVDREITRISHVAVLEAVKELKDAIANGSFAKVTRAFKGMDADLTERVNQVRKFRNWVAHGRRDAPENNVRPDDAIDRLGRYLELLAEASTPSEARPQPPMPDSSVQPPASGQPQPPLPEPSLPVQAPASEQPPET